MILMNDFKKEYSFVKPKVDKKIQETLKSGWYILGNEVSEFEKEFAKYTNSKYCIGVANGLEALQISLIALGVGKGDEVITVSNTAVATALAISNVGAKPIFVDVNKYHLIDLNKIKEKITKKTKAIIPVHLFGQMADMDPLMKIAKKYNLKIIEDACQAHGAKYKNKKAGSIGDLGCFSFYPTKNLGGYGDGGAITTNSKKLYEKCKILRNYGQKNRYEHEEKGINSRLDELQAAVLRVKLKSLDYLVKKRNSVARMYTEYLKNISEIKTPIILDNNYHSFHLYVIEAKNRNKLHKFLINKRIQSLIHYPIPIHKQKCYEEFNNITLFESEKKSKIILSLPIHPFLSKKEVVKICKTIKSFYKYEN